MDGVGGCRSLQMKSCIYVSSVTLRHYRQLLLHAGQVVVGHMTACDHYNYMHGLCRMMHM